MSNQTTPTMGKQIGAFLTVVVASGGAAAGLWTKSHFWAITVAVIGLVIYLLGFATRSVKWRFGFAVICALAGVLLYFVVPGEADIGYLQPARDPTPPNQCDNLSQSKRAPDEMVVLAGNSAFVTRDRTFMAIRYGDCALSMRKGPNGVSISVPIYDRAGKSLGEIVDNRYQISKENNLTIERSGDLSTLVVHDDEREELLYVRYLNPNTVQVRGVLSCPTPSLRTFVVTEEGMKMPGDLAISACLGSSGMRIP